jgi:urease gamma subunit
MNTYTREDADPVAEVRRIREAHAAKFNYDLAAIIADARASQAREGRQVVDLHAEALEKAACNKLPGTR